MNKEICLEHTLPPVSAPPDRNRYRQRCEEFLQQGESLDMLHHEEHYERKRRCSQPRFTANFQENIAVYTCLAWPCPQIDQDSHCKKFDLRLNWT